MPALAVIALSVAAYVPREGVCRTTAQVGKGEGVQILWHPAETPYAAVRDKAESKASARQGAKILGTERFVNGRWRVAAVGDDCPA